jgi:O-antigen/teichoic acid export membrane protein
MKIKEIFSKHGFIGNVLTLFTGSSIAQAVPILVSPILTRIFTVEQFAVLTIFTVLCSFIGVVATARYEVAVTLPDKDSDAAHLVHVSVLITLLVSFVSFIVFYFFGTGVARLFGNDDLAEVLLLVPIFVFFYGIGQVFNYWLLRDKYFRSIAGGRIFQSITNSSVSLGTGLLKAPFNGLVIGNLSGQISATGFLFYLVKKQSLLRLNPFFFSKKGMKAQAKKYSEFPKINSIQSIVDTFQSIGVVFMLSNFFGSIVVGFYGFTFKILQAPISLLGNSVALVFYKEAAGIGVPGPELRNLLKKTVLTLTIIAVPIFSVIYFWGPELFGLVFGSKWEQAGIYASAISPWLLVNFLAAPVSQIVLVLNYQKKMLLYSLVGNSLIVIALLTGILYYDDVVTALLLVSAGQVIYYVFLLRFYWSIAGKSNK